MAKFTDRQLDVLELISSKPTLTYKEIGIELGMSTSAVGKHFAQIKQKVGANSRHTMLEKLVEWQRDSDDTKVENPSCNEFNLPNDVSLDQQLRQETPGHIYEFSDSISLLADLPWDPVDEPLVVPRALDGEHASLIRIASIAMIVVGILGSLSLILAISGAITDRVEQVETSPS